MRGSAPSRRYQVFPPCTHPLQPKSKFVEYFFGFCQVYRSGPKFGSIRIRDSISANLATCSRPPPWGPPPVVIAQQREIDRLRAEVALLSRKGGHVYTTVVEEGPGFCTGGRTAPPVRFHGYKKGPRICFGAKFKNLMPNFLQFVCNIVGGFRKTIR